MTTIGMLTDINEWLESAAYDLGTGYITTMQEELEIMATELGLDQERDYCPEEFYEQEYAKWLEQYAREMDAIKEFNSLG